MFYIMTATDFAFSKQGDNNLADDTELVGSFPLIFNLSPKAKLRLH